MELLDTKREVELSIRPASHSVLEPYASFAFSIAANTLVIHPGDLHWPLVNVKHYFVADELIQPRPKVSPPPAFTPHYPLNNFEMNLVVPPLLDFNPNESPLLDGEGQRRVIHKEGMILYGNSS